MSNQIVIAERLDQNDIYTAIENEVELLFNIGNTYIDGLQNEVVNITSLPFEYQQAFKKVIDVCTFQAEQNAFFWKIERTNNTFDLSKSFQRTSIDTSTVFPEIERGKALVLRIETISFSGEVFNDISLFYDQNFITSEIDLIREKGINIEGNGKNFTVNADFECKIHFVKPNAVSDVYVISNNYNKLIERDV